jgi:putative ABC transport system permease protein
MNLLLSLKLLRRDWRAGEWRVLLIALVLAVASIATVGLFADRVRIALQQEATSLLGADLRISSTRPLPAAYQDAARQRGLRVIGMESFPSMVTSMQSGTVKSRSGQAGLQGTGQQDTGGSSNVLAEIQAVEEGYPLRGKIEINDGTLHVAHGIPARGTLWADARLMQRIGVRLGDRVGVGKLHLRLAAEVVRDVDQTIGFASFAPRVTLNEADLPASGLVQEGSRIRYSLLVAGDAKQVLGLRNWLKGRLALGEKMEDVRDARPEIRSALDRAGHFLGLAALTAVVLAGVALALAARHFISRHLDSCAMMRCLGANQAQVLRIFLYQFLLVGFCAVLIGELLGYLSQALLVNSIPSMRDAALPQPGWTPVWQAAASGFGLLLGFAFLPLWQLKSISPLRVIRRELGAPQTGTGLLYMSGGTVLCGLFLWQAGSLKLGLTVLGGLIAGLLLFGLLAWLILRALARLGSHAFSNLARHARGNAVQIVALSLGGMALLLLTFVRADLMDSWRQQLPPDAPNRFIVNIQPYQRAAVLEFFAKRGLPRPGLFPMVRGRLVAINHREISGDDYSEPRARALVERETNLSWLDHVPAGNKLVQGSWFKPGATSELSMEDGIANTLGIHLGDMLTYNVAGNRFTAKVINLRKVEWDSMQVNFFVIAAPGMLDGFPVSYITSFYLPPQHAQAMNGLVRTFPNLLLIDVGAMIAQVRHIMDQIAQTMSAVFMFTLLSGLAVLYAALLATQDERIHEAAILRTLGADSRYLRRLHLSEFAVLGLLSGLFAALGAVLLGWVLASRVLDIPYQTGIAIWLTGGLGGLGVVTVAGWLGTRRLVRLPPLAILRA